MNAAPAMAPALPPSRQPEHRPITLAMRTALGFAHTGALYREPNNTWRSRAFPQERITDATVRGLEQRAFLLLQEYEGLHGIRRACMVITPAGRRAYGGGRLAGHTPPPVQAEAILREVETALALLSVESTALAREQQHANNVAIEARRQQTLAQATLDRVEKRLAALATTRVALDARRTDLRCLVVEAAERMMGGEGRR